MEFWRERAAPQLPAELPSTSKRRRRLPRHIDARSHGHTPNPHARGRKNRIAHRGRHPNDASFPCPCRGQIFAVEQHHLNLRRVSETGNAILGEVGIQNPAIRKQNLPRTAPRRWLEPSRPSSDFAGRPDSRSRLTPRPAPRERMRTFLLAASISTSAQVATYPPLSVPPAMPNPRSGVDFLRPQPNLSAAA